MSESGTGGKVVTLRPRSAGPIAPPPLPPLPAACEPPSAAAAGVVDRQERGPGGGVPGLPGVEQMDGPPLALMMPPPPPLGGGGGGPGDGDDGVGEGEFAPPSPADPDNPTGRETLQICLAILTAMGVAAAQGMWHRARHRQAVADQSRAAADKAQAKAAGVSHEAGPRRRSGGSQTGGGGGTGSSGPGRRHRRSESPHGPSGGGSRKRRGPDDGKGGRDRPTSPKPPKAPKADRGGRAAPETGPRGSRRRRDGTGGSSGLGERPCVQTKKRKPRKGGKNGKGGSGDGASPKQPKQSKQPRGKRPGDNDGPKNEAPKTKRPKNTVRWKAPRKPAPGPGDDKAIPKRKRWRRAPDDVFDPTKPGAKRRKKGGGDKRRGHRLWWLRWVWTSSPGWLKRWRARHKKADSTATGSATGSTATAGTAGESSETGRESWARTPPPPPRGAEWMRPPPGADRTVWVTVERVDVPGAGPRPWPPGPEHAALAAAVPAFHGPAGTSTAVDATPVTAPTAQPSAAQQSAAARAAAVPTPTTGGPMPSFVPAPRTSSAGAGAQYRDAELTVYDVIEADADMAEEITEGAEEALATAAGCERLMTKLEVVHAAIVELKVPGVLADMLVRLMDKTNTVKARAEAIAANLPGAAEAIATAGGNAAARHQNPADVTRDQGHVRPAERDYHQE
ncbi:hypothetical protein [Nonomuraea typhae]|uniref:Uncharacterized protein n=1 Tax=Nonomuraea typhae TaxID=2603600 RepID=A0ABW7YSZ1_9ACTN